MAATSFVNVGGVGVCAEAFDARLPHATARARQPTGFHIVLISGSPLTVTEGRVQIRHTIPFFRSDNL
jgi:hypothetical protein